jgi:ABC-type Fe3+/spermidine/putrescine transport system ATPase subunit
MQTALKDIQTKLHITFIYVTHDQTEAITMSDRIAVIKNGMIHQVDTPDEIYNRPRTAFVASFIGEMNFFDGEVVDKGTDRLTVQVADQKVLCAHSDHSVKAGDAVVVCVRPEKVHLNPQRTLKNELQTRIRRIIFRGNEYEIRALLGAFELRAIFECKRWDRTQAVGDPIRVGWEPEDSVVFPAEMKKDIIAY